MSDQRSHVESIHEFDNLGVIPKKNLPALDLVNRWEVNHVSSRHAGRAARGYRRVRLDGERRYAALGLDCLARPSKLGDHAANADLTMLASTEDTHSSDNVRQVEYWFPQFFNRRSGCQKSSARSRDQPEGGPREIR